MSATTTSKPQDASALALVSALHRATAARRVQAAFVTEHARSVKAALDAALDAEGGSVSLKGDQEERQVIVNERPLSTKTHGRALDGLLAHFARTGVSEVRVTRALTDAEVAKLVTILRAPKDTPDPVAACRKVLEGLWSTGLRGTVDIVSLEQLGHAFAKTVKVDADTRARLVYAKLLSLVADALACEKSDELQRYFGWRLMKAVHALVTLAQEDEKKVLGLTAVRGADNYVVNHAVNTAALSVLVARKVGLPRSLLVQVGFAALLHASGKLRTPPAIVNKAPSARTPGEAREFARHPHRGVGALLEQRRLDDPVVASALVCFQHDARKGIPVTRAPLTTIHPLSQIVALCQAYDARMTAKATAPFEALAAATQDPTRPFEPVLVHVLGALVAALPAPVGARS